MQQNKITTFFQNLSQALLLPIVIMPVAGIFFRIGEPDLLNIKILTVAGNAIFSNLPIIFALGVSIGLSLHKNTNSALSAGISYIIMDAILKYIDPTINTGILGGLICGILAATIYNNFYNISLPAIFIFFSGKRFVPILSGIISVFVGIILGHIWNQVQFCINFIAHWILNSGSFGLFLYGLINRFLVLTGLHHILNNLVWFVFGSYTDQFGSVIHGDLPRFIAGDQTAGRFMAGFFPIMMFGLPSACYAMYRNAFHENKKVVGGLLLSMALTSFFTGITEPIELSFVFIAPRLFVLHAILTGFSMVVMYLLNVHLGFTFSAGFFDYLLFYKNSTNPIYLIPVGLITGIIYFIIFNYAIRKYNLTTIGRVNIHIPKSPI